MVYAMYPRSFCIPHMAISYYKYYTFKDNLFQEILKLPKYHGHPPNLLFLTMLKKIFIVFIALAALSCSENKQETTLPADILDKNKMAEIMTDLGLADAVINLKTVKNPALNPDSLVKFNIFKEHNITRKQYENNISYYSAHPVEFKEIYDMVAKKLEDMGKK